MALQVNRDFSENIKKNKNAAVQILFDGTDSNTATVAIDYANRIVKEYAKDLSPSAPGASEAIELRPRAWYNPELKSKNYNVPGVIAMVIMLTSLLLTSMAVVREREIGTMNNLWSRRLNQ